MFKKYIDLSETVCLKDFLERLQGNYELGLKFCLYYELYNAKNNFSEGRKLFKKLQKKAEKGEEEPFLLSHLELSGRDLIDRGYKGEQIGLKMKELLQMVKADPELNDREKLLSMV